MLQAYVSQYRGISNDPFTGNKLRVYVEMTFLMFSCFVILFIFIYISSCFICSVISFLYY
jgi:hypothetical protein